MQVVGSDFPARMKNGTPCQRQLSTDSHVAHGPLAQTVIDPEDARFIECPEEDRCPERGAQGAKGRRIRVVAVDVLQQ